MENFRKAMYDSCLAAGLEIVPIDIGAMVMAWVGLQGGDERVSLCPRLKTELTYLQERFRIQGGEVPDKDFVVLLQEYYRELETYTKEHDGDWPQWLYELIQDRYGFKPYKL